MYAVKDQSHVIVKFLLEFGGDIYIESKTGKTTFARFFASDKKARFSQERPFSRGF
jgi:hypothetical protein